MLAVGRDRPLLFVRSHPGPCLVLSMLSALATQAAAGEHRTFAHLQGGIAEDTHSLIIGASRDWQWEKQYRYGHVSGQWQGEVGLWHSDRANSTQVGLTPALRWRPRAWREGWFLEGGIGLNVIFPKYGTRRKAFSTTFNFGDHIALGKRFGVRHQHEWSIRVQHFSNARIEQPNPGENFLQFRYAWRP